MYNLIIWKEDEYFVGKVLENNVSSFGASSEEAYANTFEALQLYTEGTPKTYESKISQAQLYSLDLVHA